MPRVQWAATVAAASFAALALHGCGGGGGGGQKDDCDVEGATEMKTKTWTGPPSKALGLNLLGEMKVEVSIDSKAKNITAEVNAQANIIHQVNFTWKRHANDDDLTINQSSKCRSDATTVKLTVPDEIHWLHAETSTATLPSILGDVFAFLGANVSLEEWSANADKELQLRLGGGAEVDVGNVAYIGGDRMSITMASQSQLHIHKSTALLDMVDVTMSNGSVAEVQAQTGRFQLKANDSSLTLFSVASAYLKVNEGAEVHIKNASGRVVECSSGKVMDIKGNATIVPPKDAQNDTFCNPAPTLTV